LEFEQLLGILMFTCTAVTYLIFLILGRKWRKKFELRGIRYWKAPKEQRVKELMTDVWRPKLIAVFYGLAYFTNGYMKVIYSMWAPLFLLNVKGVDVFKLRFSWVLYTRRGSGKCFSAWLPMPSRCGLRRTSIEDTSGFWQQGHWVYSRR
jgi:hypothetical protein